MVVRSAGFISRDTRIVFALSIRIFFANRKSIDLGIFFEGLTFVLLVFGIFIGLILDVIILTEGGKK